MYELIVCGFGCASTLLAEHFALWNKPWRLSRPASYSLGTATLALWYFLWSVWIGVPGAGIAFAFLAGASGSAIVIAYWVRGRLQRLHKRSRAAGAASAHPLSQANIDQGYRDG